MRTFDAPSFVVQSNPIWDICFFSFPYIIETNVMVPHEPSRVDLFFSYYTKLSVFLKNRKGINFNEALCFDTEGVYSIDDTLVEPGSF